MKKNVTKPHKQQHFIKRHKRIFIPLGVILALILGVLIAFRVSPFPGAFIIRTVFESDAKRTYAPLQEHVPSQPIQTIKDQAYDTDQETKLDVYIPSNTAKTNPALPVVIWTHGGAWLSGDKRDTGRYFELLADQGFVVISLNYSLAPGKAYPTQLHQLNKAHSYVVANASRFGLNPFRIILAGDSAGSQLSSEIAAIITNPTYAKEVGITPSLKPSQLTGVVLFCGIYDMKKLATPDDKLPKIVGWGDNVAVWSYSGVKDDDAAILTQMSPIHYVTASFPPTFISGGNSDPLTDQQSIPLANKLTSLGVNVTSLFYPKDHTPPLPHEYQFTLNDDGLKAFQATSAFIKKITSANP